MIPRRPQSSPDRRKAFTGIVDQYEERLLRYAYRILQGSDTAQDTVQEAFIRLFKHWKDTLEPSPAISSWLYRTVHNLAVDHIRRESRRRALHEDHAGQQPGCVPPDRGDHFRIPGQAEQAAQALQTLNLREQQLVILKIYEEKSYKEISEITGLSSGNVGYILHHAMKKLAQTMRQDETDTRTK